jgi:hypothetical protein
MAVHLATSLDGLVWSITAINTMPFAIEGDVQIEWRLPEVTRDRILLFEPDYVDLPRSMMVDMNPLNRPESFVHLWIGERFTVSLQAGESVTLSGRLLGSPDVDQDGEVSAADISEVLSSWGQNCCFADINIDGTVDLHDLTVVLAAIPGE